MTEQMTPLERAREVQKANRENGIKVQYKSPMEKAKEKPKSRSLAVDAMCYQCIYDKLDKGSWRQQVKACTSPDCALYQVRPMPKTRAERGLV